MSNFNAKVYLLINQPILKKIWRTVWRWNLKANTKIAFKSGKAVDNVSLNQMRIISKDTINQMTYNNTGGKNKKVDPIFSESFSSITSFIWLRETFLIINYLCIVTHVYFNNNAVNYSTINIISTEEKQKKENHLFYANTKVVQKGR